MSGSRDGIEPTALVLAGAEVLAAGRGRHVVLRRNDVGNLAILIDGAYVGVVDLDSGDVQWHDGFVPPWGAS